MIDFKQRKLNLSVIKRFFLNSIDKTGLKCKKSGEFYNPTQIFELILVKIKYYFFSLNK